MVIFIYRMSHRVPAAFKLVYGHLNSIFLTGNFAWAFPRHFANSGQKDFAKFLNFDPCTVCGKTLQDSGGVYLPAFWATPLYYLVFGPHPIVTVSCLGDHIPIWKQQELRGTYGISLFWPFLTHTYVWIRAYNLYISY